MAGSPRQTSSETVRAIALMVGLELNEADLQSVAERAQAAALDVESLDELDPSDHEPAITFGTDEGRR